MDIYDYNLLTLGERATMLWQKARYIDRYSDTEKTASLYHIHNFYVEAVVSHRDNCIVDVTPFKMGPRFEKYLMRVDLHDLV